MKKENWQMRNAFERSTTPMQILP